MLRFTICTTLCLCFISLYSQNIRPLTIGDHFPATGNNAVINHTDSVINLSGYTDKLLILDFWATWCTACIGVFPKIDSLQKAFKDDIKIVLVNVSDPETKIEPFFKKYEQKRGSQLNLPSIWGETDFFTLLPHRSIPHYAWIYRNKLIATTGPDEVTAKNITSVLTNETLRFRMKKDVIDYDRDRPLLENGNGGDSVAFGFKTFFAGELPGMKRGYLYSNTAMHRKNSYINFSITDLISVVTRIPPYLMMLRLPDTANYSGVKTSTYCYEIIAPAGTTDTILQKMILQDLSRYLNLSVSIQKKKIPVYRLVMSAKRKRAPADTAAGSMLYNKDNTVLTFKATRLRFVTLHLNAGWADLPGQRPIVDDTGYQGPVTLAVPSGAKSDIGLLRNILAKEGIRLKSGRKRLTVCIINAADGRH